jgi:hypothetical protein
MKPGKMRPGMPRALEMRRRLMESRVVKDAYVWP